MTEAKFLIFLFLPTVETFFQDSFLKLLRRQQGRRWMERLLCLSPPAELCHKAMPTQLCLLPVPLPTSYSYLACNWTSKLSWEGQELEETH